MLLKPYSIDTSAGAPETGYAFWCPACRQPHRVTLVSPIDKRPTWKFNGSLEKPTFTPSWLQYTPKGKWGEDGIWRETGRTTNCHLHVTNGSISFCGDCPHEFKGKTVPLPEWPDDAEVFNW